MASTSVRNLASQIGAMACAKFIPTPKKWDHSKVLPKGLNLLLQIMKNITVSHFKPISPAYLLNEDCSSQYYFSGLTRNNYMNNGWYRVTTESLVSRNKDII